MSLRARLLAGLALVVVVLVGVSAIITATTRGQLLAQVDSRLLSLAPHVLDGRFPSIPDLPVGDRPPPPDGSERVSDVYEGIVDADGTVRDLFTPNFGDDDFGAPQVVSSDLPTAGAAYFTAPASAGDTTYRVYAQRVGDSVWLTAVPMDDVEETIGTLVLVEVLGSIAILAALGLVGWWVVHLGIRPIKEMTETATRIADGDLAVRVESGDPGTEVGQLAGALNQMLGQIEQALDQRAASEDRLRRFVADASHELRTPVTTIRGYAELYRRGGLADPDHLADAMRRTEQEAARMGRLVEDMLTLAKLDEHRPIATRPVDLAVVAADAVTDARAIAPGRSISVGGAGSATVVGDEDRIRQVVANVIGNAIVHTADDVAIAVTVETRGELVDIAVRDEGDGMPAEIVERVTERFFRADPARSRHRGGSGLGLSIVDATLAAHGGAVTIESAPHAGTTVTLTFPRAGGDPQRTLGQPTDSSEPSALG